MYYPLLPEEVAGRVRLKLTQSASYLLDLIKAHAPYGKKLFFGETFNADTLAKELGMHRTTFDRARKTLVDRGLVEFNTYYVRDKHTVDRSHFKNEKKALEQPEVKPLKIFDQLFHALQTAGLLKDEQPCTKRSIEPIKLNVSSLL